MDELFEQAQNSSCFSRDSALLLESMGKRFSAVATEASVSPDCSTLGKRTNKDFCCNGLRGKREDFKCPVELSWSGYQELIEMTCTDGTGHMCAPRMLSACWGITNPSDGLFRGLYNHE